MKRELRLQSNSSKSVELFQLYGLLTLKRALSIIARDLALSVVGNIVPKREKVSLKRIIDKQESNGSVQVRFFVLFDPPFSPFSIA
jgi:hypothetical protein